MNHLSSKTYTPISCSLYDELELLAMRKQPVVLELTHGETLKVVIKTFETRKGEGEFLLGVAGEEIRLDKIAKVDGNEFSLSC
jgi:transcriptional antiterminator Rof (Rho-off)